MNEFTVRIGTDGRLSIIEGIAATREGFTILLSGYVGDTSPKSPGGDPETMLERAWDRHGFDAAAKLSGEFVTLLHDAGRRTTAVLADAIGMRSAFYAKDQSGVRISTHLEALIGPDDALRIDEDYIAEFLAHGFIGSARTPYRGVQRLMPGEALQVRQNEITLQKCWSVGEVAKRRTGRPPDWDEEFRSVLTDATSLSLSGAYGKAWISLSGGLDSSTLACTATRSGAGVIRAYSVIAPSWPDTDERKWIDAVNAQTGMPGHALDVEDMLPFAALPRETHGEPTHTVIEQARLSRQDALFHAQGGGVMLTGHGGDAVLGAAPGALPSHLADAWFEGRPLAALGDLRRWQAGTPERRSMSYWLLNGLARPILDHAAGRRARAIREHKPSPPWLARDYLESSRIRERMIQTRAPRARTPGQQRLADDLWVMAIDNAAAPRRPGSMEYRNPLMHRPLVEFMASMPWEQHYTPTADRILQRRALMGILPESVRTRSSKGNGNIAIVEGLRRSTKWLAYLCDDPELARRGIVDRDQWRLWVNRARVGQTYSDRDLLAAIAVEVWLKQLKDCVPIKTGAIG